MGLENMALRISPKLAHNVLVIFMHHFSLVSVKKIGPVFYNQCLKFIFLPLDSGIFIFLVFGTSRDSFSKNEQLGMKNFQDVKTEKNN